ncbi:uncharacterized protein LOC128163651 [Crassostrea angulata]|uniref:uncharacterized protein LOC128163651 n=1 Tax=Magallana angulata TaxID=2784310 RepID=UPI0022B0D4DA|nr:uncharacterized protein LOC128163651 [Crassostrea angulata]
MSKIYRMYTKQGVLVFMGFAFDFLSVSGQTVNLPNKVTIPENTETGVTIFTIKGEKTSFELVNQYPEVTSEVLEYDARGQVIKIRSGNLFDYEGEHRTYVMRFQETSTEIPTPDLILVIEVEDVKEASDTGSLSSGSSGCCDDISTIRWMVPAFTAVVLFVLIVSCSILLICILKTKNRITVEN